MFCDWFRWACQACVCVLRGLHSFRGRSLPCCVCAGFGGLLGGVCHVSRVWRCSVFLQGFASLHVTMRALGFRSYLLRWFLLLSKSSFELLGSLSITTIGWFFTIFVCILLLTNLFQHHLLVEQFVSPYYGCPEIGVPPVIIHFRLGFPMINQPAIGVPPWLWKPPYVNQNFCWLFLPKKTCEVGHFEASKDDAQRALELRPNWGRLEKRWGKTMGKKHEKYWKNMKPAEKTMETADLMWDVHGIYRICFANTFSKWQFFQSSNMITLLHGGMGLERLVDPKLASFGDFSGST